MSTSAEVVLWKHIRNSHLGYKFGRQVDVGSFVVDFYCSECKIAIELDGYQHRSRKMYDNNRSKYLGALGIRVLRFWNQEVEDNLDVVLEEIKKFLTLHSNGASLS